MCLNVPLDVSKRKLDVVDKIRGNMCTRGALTDDSPGTWSIKLASSGELLNFGLRNTY